MGDGAQQRVLDLIAPGRGGEQLGPGIQPGRADLAQAGVRRLARRRGHGEAQVRHRTGQLARAVDLDPVLLALVQGAAEDAHAPPQVGRLHGVVVQLHRLAPGARLGRGGQAQRALAHAAIDRARQRRRRDDQAQQEQGERAHGARVWPVRVSGACWPKRRPAPAVFPANAGTQRVGGFSRDTSRFPREAGTPGLNRAYSLVMRCPPKPLRIAASSLSAKESFSRERRRSSRDRVITGADTSRSSASLAVQRPSPESST